MIGKLSRTQAQREVFRLKTVKLEELGWSPRIRQRFGYFTPDECYESTLLQIIDAETAWLDVGCGHDLFPSNEPLAELLSARCQVLVGIDPSPNIQKNPFLHERIESRLEDYQTDRRFDVISLRMVAEHIADPCAALLALSRLTKVGGRVIIYTVGKYALSSLVAATTPMMIHHFAKRILWGTLPEDTFPTLYRMNTRARLLTLFSAAGFVEEEFAYLNDCRSLARWRMTMMLELSAERAFRTVGLRYPDFCLLGVYRKQL